MMPDGWRTICFDFSMQGKENFDRLVWIMIGVFAILRTLTAAVLELGNDEAYYWLYSRQLQWNYFDHPPLIAIWIRFFTLNGLLHDYEAAIRMGSIVSCAFATWFLFRAVSLVHDKRAGWFAACLFNASFYAGMVAGLLAMPDSPQLFFWTFALWQLARLFKNENNKWTWVLFGCSAGLCIMSKVHGVFLVAGFVLFVLFRKREWLQQPLFYISGLIAALVSMPILIWNMQHDFVSLRFHSTRIDITHEPPVKESFIYETVSQVIITNPVNFLLAVMGLVWLFRQRIRDEFLTACNFIALPFIALVVFLSLFRDIWFHWTGPAFVTLIPLAALRMAERSKKVLFPAALRWSTLLFVLVLAGWPLLVHFYPGTYGNENVKMLGKGDVTLDKFGWEKSGEYFAHEYNKAVARGIVSPEAPVVCPTWWGAHIEYYFARKAGVPVIGLGDTLRIGQYSWLNEKRLASADLDTAILIEPSIEHGKAGEFYRDHYRENKLLFTLAVYRNGRAASNFYVSRLSGWKGMDPEPAVESPRLAYQPDGNTR